MDVDRQALIEIRATLETTAAKYGAINRMRRALKLIDDALARSAPCAPQPGVLHEFAHEYRSTHAFGFMWNESRRMYEESEARYRTRVKTYLRVRDCAQSIREAAGTTLQELYVRDLCLLLSHLEGFELDSAAAALGAAPRDPASIPDPLYQQRLQGVATALAS